MRLKSRLALAALSALLCVVLALPTVAQEATRYEDPEGRFSVDIPEGMTDESTADYGYFTMENGVSAYLLAVEAADLDAGIERVLEIAAPDFAGEDEMMSSQVPAPNGIWTQNIYSGGLFGPLVALLAQEVDGVTYAMVFHAPNQGALQASINEVNGIVLGFSIGESLDLTDVEPARLTEEDFEAIEAFVNEAMEQYNVPGAAVAIAQNGEVIYTGGFGVQEPGGNEPVDSETLFMIGSTTKSMTTMMMAALVDEGVLDWETPVTEILPEFALSDAEVTPQIRVRDLFGMATGVPRYDLPIMLQMFTPEMVVEELATIPLIAAPGEQFAYSNFMVALGGYVAALASGAVYGENVYETYVDLMQAYVFDPIGMTSTTFDFDAAQANENHALPVTYDYLSGEWVDVPIDFERFAVSVAPAGSVWSNAEDMGRYLVTELNRGVAPDGTRVVSEENLLETQTAGVLIGGPMSYGMGWFVEEYNGVPLIQHGGNTSGFSSDFAFLPTKDLGVSVLSSRGGASSFGAAVREYVFELAFGLEHTSAERYELSEEQLFGLLSNAYANVRVQDVNETDVEPYLGEYERGLTVTYEDGRLLFNTALGVIPAMSTGDEGEFISIGALGGTLAEFEEEDGEMTLTIRPMIDLEGSGQRLVLVKRD